MALIRPFNSALPDGYVFLCLCVWMANDPIFLPCSLHLYTTLSRCYYTCIKHRHDSLAASVFFIMLAWIFVDNHQFLSQNRPRPLQLCSLCSVIRIPDYAAVVFLALTKVTVCDWMRVISLLSPAGGACSLTSCSPLRLQPQIMGHCVRLREVESPQGCWVYYAGWQLPYQQKHKRESVLQNVWWKQVC